MRMWVRDRGWGKAFPAFRGRHSRLQIIMIRMSYTGDPHIWGYLESFGKTRSPTNHLHILLSQTTRESEFICGRLFDNNYILNKV